MAIDPMLRLALLTSDNREICNRYEEREPEFGPAPQALIDGMAELPGLEVDILSCAQRPVTTGMRLASNIRYHALHVPKIGWLRTGYQGCIRAVRRTVRALQPNIVHGQGTERDCAISAILSGFPNVLTIHGNMRSIAALHRVRPFSFHWCTALLEGFVLPRTHGVVCITRYTRQAVGNLAKRTWIVPNAVDATFFDIVPERPVVPRILVVGTICRHKNQIEFIHALDELKVKDRIETVFLGVSSAADPYSKEFLELLKTRPWCRYPGFAGRASMKEWMRQSSLLALPSLEDNCPMVVLEAMAGGVPVVASRIGGVPDLIEDGVNGLFCDPRSRKSMRAAVERLLGDEESARAMAARAKARARERYEPRIIAGRHLEIYRELLDQLPRRRS